jgi:hypothetical protein
MHLSIVNSAVLLLALLAILPALDHFHIKPFGDRRPRVRLSFRDFFASELGVAVVTYLSDFAGYGTTTPPTAAQASQLPCQVAEVFLADTDTEAIVVHNWGYALGPSFASFRWPIVIMNKALGAGAGGSASFGANFTFGLTNSLQVYIEKPAGAAGGTFEVYLLLPTSYIAKQR